METAVRAVEWHKLSEEEGVDEISLTYSESLFSSGELIGSGPRNGKVFELN